MGVLRFSERTVLYSYFLVLICLGTLGLSFSISWKGNGELSRAPLIDALFTAVSAVCVTGLVTVDTTLWSRTGQLILLFLIQAGGLGMALFGVFYLVVRRYRLSLRRQQLFRDSFSITQTLSIRRMIFVMLSATVLIQGVGAWILYPKFSWFEAIFHSVSAFCNAGFSLFSGGLTVFREDVLVNLVLMGLILLGGAGFIVLYDLFCCVQRGRHRLFFHTKLMLMASALFVAVGGMLYLWLEKDGVFRELSPMKRVLAAFFQSVTTRTAGFNTVEQANLSVPSRWITLLLMFVGGGSGSTAGGIKVSTAFILLLGLFRGINEDGDIRFLNRKISAEKVSKAAFFFLKAAGLLALSILILGIIENPRRTGFRASDIVFESVSALGTVGLSTGITGSLSVWGKVVLICTMFAGRVGLFSLVVREHKSKVERLTDYPEGEVFIG